MRITLANDGWADLRDPASLTNGQRKPIMKLVGKFPTGADGKADMAKVVASSIFEIGDTMLRAFITAWSYGDLPGDDPDGFDDVLASDYDLLQIEAGKLIQQLQPAALPGSGPT